MPGSNGQSETDDRAFGAGQDQEARLYAEAILDTMRQPLVVLNGDLRVITANRAFYRTFEVDRAETEGRLIYELGDGQWNIPRLRELLEDVLPNNGNVEDFKVEHDFEQIGRRVMMLNAHRMQGAKRANTILLAIDDITEQEHARALLRAEKEYVEKIVDSSRDALLILDFDLRVKSANETFYNTFRVDPSETEGRMVYELGNGQWDIPKLRDLLENVLPEDDAFDNFEVEHDFADLGHRTMILNARRVDHMQLILLAIEDQTEARRASRALRESEARYRRLFESIDEGFCIIEMLFDEDGRPIDYRFLEVNPAFVRHTGLENAVGRRMRELAPDHEQYWFDIYGRIATSGEPARFERAAGHLGDRWYDVYAFPIDRPEDRLVAVLFRDVAHRKAAEAALAESEARYRVLVESAAVAVWESDPAGNVLADSPSWRAFTGQTREEWFGPGWLDAVHPDSRDAAERGWEETISRGQPLDCELRIRRADGGWCWCRVQAAPLSDGEGGIVKWVGMTSDISRRKEAEEERELLLGELNHRVKNIFAVIRSLAAQGGGGPEVERHKAVFLARLDALVAAHTLALDSRWSNIAFAELVARTLEPYMVEQPEAVEIGGDPVRLEARRALSVALALHELATNAVKYGALSSPEGRVLVAWRLVEQGGERRAVLTWEERGGPAVRPPEDGGFGTRLIERVFTYELHGDAEFEFRPDGVRLEGSFPLS